MSGDNNVYIAVMGMTGAGKSTFIKQVTGRDDVYVGHSLESATEEVVPYSFSYGGFNITLIDTPGFDDSRFNDDVIVDKILEWLRTSANQNQRLSGIVYMHRITDNRIQGSARSSMQMFRRLCGPEYFSNVVLATSFWNSVDLSVGARRERELYENDDFCGLLSKQGLRIARTGYGVREDRRLLLKIAQNKTALLEAQKQMQAGVPPCKTAAAEAVADDLNHWAQIFNKDLEDMRARNREVLAERKRQRRQEYNAQKLAMEEEDRRRQEEDLARIEKQQKAWAARQEARKARQKDQLKEDNKQLKELRRRKEEEEARQREAAAQANTGASCRRKPVSELWIAV
ncbi:uncharacterized protein HMPREF1541_10673 [Cyphellophora europaea CBS 101466]|uniref:G domain-containing protein n=1 Tax=Cyphellophora europaea (strain CBS 101466) TaxID=1220924 RepID=W2S7U7_CYPE1|nr:uncharacterized protein HMPREF1541_10673 [Cyphellophora europaea CBS 101466]ETN44123.1 hypothetical protein HMPREF1541_10673 [Cyphellophora europaea CBS 101466]